MDERGIVQNKLAWEHLVYEWRCENQGTPQSLAQNIRLEPQKFLRFHSEIFSNVTGKKVANICGSDGQRAVPLAILGADVTVFDISAPQKEYALALAKSAGVDINYVVGDFCSLDKEAYRCYFDYTYCEGGIMHYFHDISLFFGTIYQILKPGALMVFSDFHPINKAIRAENPKRNVEMCLGNYFDTAIHEGHVPYAKYFPEDMQKNFPSCKLRFYTLSEIINAVISAGLEIKEIQEHPKYNDKNFPGELTIIAKK